MRMYGYVCMCMRVCMSMFTQSTKGVGVSVFPVSKYENTVECSNKDTQTHTLLTSPCKPKLINSVTYCCLI